MTSPPQSEFPTLAEMLARGSEEPPAAAPVVAVVEGQSEATDVERSLPAGSVVAIVSTTAIEVSGQGHHAATLAGLTELVRSNVGDILFVSGEARPTRSEVSGLTRSLASDSACTTVSLDGRSRPAVPGLPPPAVDTPRGGVVLVRRDDLLLAADEADLASCFGERSPVAGWGPLVGSVLALLERPGFVHRASGGVSEAVDDAQGSSAPPRRKATARILVDGSFLAHRLAGTQVQALALVRALVRTGADLVVLRPREIHPTVEPSLDELVAQIPVLEREQVGQPDVVHRMSQIFSLHELADRLVIGERFVLTHQDMIWDRTPAYHVGDARRDYRRATTATLALADHVGFFSLHAARDAASDGGLELDRATVVPLGVDHLADRDVPDSPARPLGGRPYLLMVGSSFRHKNRVFAFRLLERLVDRGWEGGLVLVGGESGSGSSVPAERRFADAKPALNGRVRSLGHVEDAEQLALYRDAELVLFPSLYEGFGFIPFEAAFLGTASVYTRRSSMGELLPEVGGLSSFDVDEAAEQVLRLLARPDERARIVAEISAKAATLTWERTAAGYLEVYEQALARPQRASVAVLRAARELATRGAPSPHEALLLDVYRRRRASRLVVDSTFRLGTAVRRGVRTIGRRSDPSA